jgi:hypothetical protein
MSDLQSVIAAVRHDGRQRSTRCPAHDDRRASLSVGLGSDGKTLLNCHAGCTWKAVVDAAGLSKSDLVERQNGNGGATETRQLRRQRERQEAKYGQRRLIATYRYVDEQGALQFEVLRYEPKDFRQRRPDGHGGWIWSTAGLRPLLYRLDQIQQRDSLLIVEGEQDCDVLWGLGLPATCNAGGAGPNKWKPEHTRQLLDAGVQAVAVIPDNDDAGRRHADDVARSIHGAGLRVRLLTLPDLPPHGDTSDYLRQHSKDELIALATAAPLYEPAEPGPPAADAVEAAVATVALTDFYAYMPMHQYLFVPSRDLWPAASVNARVRPVRVGDDVVAATAYLDEHQPVEQMTWAPGEPMLIHGRVISDGGWISHEGVTVFNLYRPSSLVPGHAHEAEPWVNHVRLTYPDDADHIIKWNAHRVQRPHEKINHALVLGGLQGIGKDTLVEPVKYAIGPWNFVDVSPAHLLGRFNGFVKSVILRVSEARDLGDVNRFAFYDHLKVYTASPPDVLRCDEKNLHEYVVPNVTGILMTTNHKTDGIYLPADDRRHYVAWSTFTKEDFTAAYWRELYKWYEGGGYAHVAAYLHAVDLSDFDPKAPPPHTEAFHDIVNANRAPEDAELADALDALASPAAVTLGAIEGRATSDFAAWLRDRKNSRVIPHRLEAVGYVPVRNPGPKDGLWKVAGRRQVVYAKHELALRERLQAAKDLTEGKQ